jgi:hypothetical protein
LSSAEVLLTVISTVVGALIGLATSHYYYRRGLSAGPRMVVGLTEKARIEPATVGVKVEMKVGPIEVTNLVVLEVAVSNPGDKNLDLKDADDGDRHRKRPRIELPSGLRAVADPWNPDGVPTRADVRVARQLRSTDERQVLYVHVHGLAAGATARSTVLCTYWKDPAPPTALTGAELRFFPGLDDQFTARGGGLLKDAVVLTD